LKTSGGELVANSREQENGSRTLDEQTCKPYGNGAEAIGHWPRAGHYRFRGEMPRGYLDGIFSAA